MEQYDASTELWDQVYSECELVDLNGEKLKVEPTFDACLRIFSQNTHRVLDYGCGTGDILFQCADFGYLTYGMGIDRSEVGIHYAEKMAHLNHYQQLDFVTGDIDNLKQMDDECFDGILLSNVLDVTPKDIAHTIFTEITRILQSGGYLFLKLNPYINKDDLIQLGLTPIGDNLYAEDGVLRLRELDTPTWYHILEPSYTVERYLEFPYPWQEGMNRLFLLKKK
ncbi:Methyltransferase domain-containing protein [Anaerosporobacter mobilis DSM 15930]|jgi:ubiquinone/menaquinone biosynthesis C-methylase UbiE|uniref:Methyltransferase domain-containing protein n=1 Tax=Anaerosporobacter mobilis DSM 15930 TaxID=1120996 RepID=A0A1M7KPQ6_9FIRM|nr:class I SAM-dependent methyltransferase [Anaerosporobacter mobilis]SHM67419.1 Methyltransferase domain-containing protein [Anaerosporobacter mobilis DSM 15930]